MKKIGENYLFVVNAFLITGLIGLAFWLQQTSAVITPALPKATNTQIVSAATSTAHAQIISAAPSTTASVGQSTPTTTPPIIRQPRENESGEKNIDE